MIWLPVLIVALILGAATDLIDSHLINSRFKHSESIVFFSSFFNLLVMPFLALTGFVTLINAEQAWWFLLIGFCQVVYLYPYYKAQKIEDASIVNSFFIMERVFTPILAFFLLHEQFTVLQYVGLGVIIVARLFFQMNSKYFHFSWIVLILISLSCFLLSINNVTTKHVLGDLHWVNVTFWCLGGSFLVNNLFLLWPQFRNKVREDIPNLKANGKELVLNEVVCTSSNSLGILLASMLPITKASALFSFKPFFVLGVSWIASKFLHVSWREDHSREAMTKKIILLATMVFGAVLLSYK
jgi:drug/metabolite transporter (DMT)-like permease